MSRKSIMALQCTLACGPRADEYVFRLRLHNGGEHVGVSPDVCCWTRSGEGRQPPVPADGSLIDGLVAVRVLAKSDAFVRVLAPGGEVLEVPGELLEDLPDIPDAAALPL